MRDIDPSQMSNLSDLSELDEIEDLSQVQAKAVKKICNQKLLKDKKRLEKNKMIEINTIKRHAQTDAIQFVKEASAEVEKALTSEIRLILK